MRDFVYPPVIAGLKTWFKAIDLKISVEGAEHIPQEGGAVLAATHVSYLDFIFTGFAALPVKRLVRFMAKKEIFANRFAGPLMRGMHHISVDRDAGLASYKEALSHLKQGELVGVFPEATTSQTFVVKEIKSGAVRMAIATGTPLIPMTVWGGQRLAGKGRKTELTKRHVPITVIAGEPMHPTRKDDVRELTTELQARMHALLDRAQREYPDQPKGDDDRWWLPAHLGGTAPAPETQVTGGDERTGLDTAP